MPSASLWSATGLAAQSTLACCEFFPHPEASSSSNLTAKVHHPQCPQQNHSHPQTYLDPCADGKADGPCAFDAYCCHDEYCDDTDNAECCEEDDCGEQDECCDEPACEVQVSSSGTQQCAKGPNCVCALTPSLQEMMCSGMDCGQIEQYLDCCRAACLVEGASPNDLPSVPFNTPTAAPSATGTPTHLQTHFSAPAIHPSPNTALISLLSAAAELGELPAGPITQNKALAGIPQWQPPESFKHQGLQPPWTGSDSLTSQPQPIAIPANTNVCHWANCHQTFSTVHALLMHLSEDHLSTKAQAAASEEARAQAERQKQIEAETNQLLACLWDDCLPLPSAAHAFDPSRMDVDAPVDAVLRHVLNDHLGGPSCFPGSTSTGQGCVTHAQIQPQNTPPTPQLLTPSSVLSPVFSTHSNFSNPAHFDLGPQASERTHARSQSAGSIGAVRQYPSSRQRIHPHSHPHSHAHTHIHPHPHTHAHPQAHSHPHPHNHNHSHVHTHHKHHTHSHDHAQKQIHQCKMPNCSLTFPDTASLTEHISDDHIGRGMRTYACEWEGCCGEDGKRKVFASRQKITRHLQSHTGHKPFICEICDQAFSEAAPLTAHMRRHSKEKPYKCTVPGCDKAFSIAASLTIHLRTHRGEKPFVCPHCNKGFVEASNLTKHIRTHTGERPFPCLHPGCDKRFSRPDQLKRHGSVHTKHLARSPEPDTAVTSRAGSVSRSVSDSSEL